MESEVRGVLAFLGRSGSLGRTMRLNASMLLSFSGCLANRGMLLGDISLSCLLQTSVPHSLVSSSVTMPSNLRTYGSFLFKSPQKGSRLGLDCARECRNALHGKSSSELCSECVCHNTSTQGRLYIKINMGLDCR